MIAEGKLLYPDSKDQCQYGVELLAEKTPDISIKCCVKKKCGPGLAGVCQNQHKQCKGSFVAYVLPSLLFLSFLFFFSFRSFPFLIIYMYTYIRTFIFLTKALLNYYDMFLVVGIPA